MQVLFDKKLIPKILRGEKTTTIRLKKIGEPGKIFYISAGGLPVAKAVITKVEKYRLGDIPDEIVRKEGFSSFRELFKNLRRYYREITADTEVYVIHFRVIER